MNAPRSPSLQFNIQLKHTPHFPPSSSSSSSSSSSWLSFGAPKPVPPRLVARASTPHPAHRTQLLSYATHGLLHRAWSLWLHLLSDPSFIPDLHLLSLLISACGTARRFDLVLRILDDLSSAALPPHLLPQVHSVVISCFADHAQLHLMEHTLSLMLSRGFPIDSATGDAFLRYYSRFASLDDMENAYSWLKRSRHLPRQVGIRAVALAYVRDRKLYRMSLFWDLHLSLEHMKRTSIVPDLVTYGCVVDSYLDRRLGRNLRFALDKMNLDDSPQVLTDSFVFEAFGKGNFHSTSEAFLEFPRNSPWTYRKVVTTYLRKQYRRDRNQIFWNY